MARLENAEAEYKNEKILDNQVDLFFQLNFGSIYESLGYYLMALKYYWKARAISDKLDGTNPDNALVYCALGTLYC